MSERSHEQEPRRFDPKAFIVVCTLLLLIVAMLAIAMCKGWVFPQW